MPWNTCRLSQNNTTTEALWEDLFPQRSQLLTDEVGRKRRDKKLWIKFKVYKTIFRVKLSKTAILLYYIIFLGKYSYLFIFSDLIFLLLNHFKLIFIIIIFYLKNFIFFLSLKIYTNLKIRINTYKDWLAP